MDRISLKLFLSGILAAILLLPGCATVYNPATEQRELIFVTTPVEVSLGNVLAARVSKDYKISKDPSQNNRVKDIGAKIAAVSDRKDLKYQFFVIEDEALNAFTTPGGYVYINSGLLDKSSDDELACVIGHEIGHIAARHVAKKLQSQIGYDILMNIAVSRTGAGAELQKAASITYNLISLGYSRSDELTADRLGVKYAYKAGYDPNAMISFLKKIQDMKEEQMGFVFLRSHPYTSDRIKKLQQQMPGIIEKVNKQTSSIATKENITTGSAPAVTEEKRPLKVMCPVCRRIYSGTTGYCPYDGTELK
jgi:predicted Zn-dependent protease